MVQGRAANPNKAAVSAGLRPKSSFKKKVSPNRASPKIPWTKYTNKMAISSGVGSLPKRMWVWNHRCQDDRGQGWAEAG